MALPMKFLPLAVSLFAGFCPVGKACQICIPFPKSSAADYLFEAEIVVLAREDPERPFHLRAVEVLKGRPGAEKIDLFLDSTSRRTLGIFPERSVVLVKGGAEVQEGWLRVGMADEAFGPLVRELLDSAPAWEKEPGLRIEFFGKLLGHEDAQIRRLAHLEVAGASYREIKGLKNVLPRDEIHAFLNNFRYVEWHALYILLLAQSGDPTDREFISEAFHSAARFKSSLSLGAWATAYIELEEEKAIEFIEAEFFRNSGHSPAALRDVTMALSVHGSNGHTHLRDRIVASYGTLLAKYPAMTPDVAKDLIAWNRTELTSEVASYVAAHQLELDLATALELMAYSRKAQPDEYPAERLEK
jgi:hypothetical protein